MASKYNTRVKVPASISTNTLINVSNETCDGATFNSVGGVNSLNSVERVVLNVNSDIVEHTDYTELEPGTFNGKIKNNGINTYNLRSTRKVSPVKSFSASLVFKSKRSENVTNILHKFAKYNYRCNVILNKCTQVEHIGKDDSSSKKADLTPRSLSHSVLSTGCNATKVFKLLSSHNFDCSVHISKCNLLSSHDKNNANGIGNVAGSRGNRVSNDSVHIVNAQDRSKDFKIEHCSRKNCKFCPSIITSHTFSSNVTHRKYCSVIHKDIHIVNCKSRNLIYLITCNRCNLQYVGETIQELRRRFSQYGTDIRQGKLDFYVIQHFSSGSCQNSTYSINIIEILEGTGRTEEGKACPAFTAYRKKKETEWMFKLRTVYPYGMNEKVTEGQNFGKYENDRCQHIGKLFPPLPRFFQRNDNSKKDYVTTPFDKQTIINLILDKINNDLKNAFYYIRILLSSQSKKNLKSLACEFLDLTDVGDSYRFQLFKMALDIIDCKIYRPPKPICKRQPPIYRLNLPFCSKAFDFINLSRILRCDEGKISRPTEMDDTDIPMVVYSLSTPIRSKILNYGKFVSNFDLGAFHLDHNSVPCHCSEFDAKFIDDHHKHIISGDLSIINSIKLRNVFKKGPKYREPAQIDFDEARGSIAECLDSFIEQLTTVKKLDDGNIFCNWKNKIMELVDNNITNVKRNFLQKEVVSIFNDPNVKSELLSLHRKFVMVPIDKASNNVAIICKQFYASVIYNELDFANISSISQQQTYEKVENLSPNDIIMQHCNYQKNINIDVDEEMKHLPTMYWTPKMHKEIIGARFIIASKLSSLKPLAQDLTKIFQCVFAHVRAYYRKARFYSGLNHFWVIDNNTNLISAMDRINKKGNAKSIATYDFSTLYTKIPHDQLLHSINFLLDLAFDDKSRKYLSVTKSGAHWVKGSKTVGKRYDVNDVKDALKYLVYNSFFLVGDNVFRQKIGMPMGSDPAPYLANLYLAHRETEWIKNLKTSDYGRARRFLNAFRFIDDLITLNDSDEFQRSFSEIYPPELVLKKENTSNDKATFLDMEIIIQDNRFMYNLYDKRDYFNFAIVRFPFKCSNIPSKIFFSTIGAETLRICNASSTFSGFLESSKPFYSRMLKQGAKSDNIKNVFKKFYKRHKVAFQKFSMDGDEIVSKLS